VIYVYILRCADNSLYIGQTDDLELRVMRHNEGRGCAFTANRGPVVLVYSEAYSTRNGASRRERQLKRWTRRKKEALITGDLELLKKL
jgi:predicted GIY-YIG superfamily endonuclease